MHCADNKDGVSTSVFVRLTVVILLYMYCTERYRAGQARPRRSEGQRRYFRRAPARRQVFYRRRPRDPSTHDAAGHITGAIYAVLYGGWYR